MANLLYKNKKIYKKIQELSREIQENIELLEQEEKTKQYQKPLNQLQYPIQPQPQPSIQSKNIILTINDNDSIIIKKDTQSTTATRPTRAITATTTTTSTTATKEKNLNHVKPPAGRVGTKWDPTIIHWKNSLRGYYFF